MEPCVGDMTPIILRAICWALGLETFTVSVSGRSPNAVEVHFKRSAPASVYSGLVIASQTVFWAHRLAYYVGQNWTDVEFTWSSSSLVTALYVATLTSLVGMNINYGHRRQIVQTLCHVDQGLGPNLRNYGGSRNLTKMTTIFLSYFTIQGFMELWVLWLQSYLFTLINVACFIIYHLIFVTVSLNYTCWVLLVKQRLVILNRELGNVSSNFSLHNFLREFEPTTRITRINVLHNVSLGTHNLHSAARILSIRVTYEKLCKIIDLINVAYGIQVLSLILAVLVVITNGIHLGVYIKFNYPNTSFSMFYVFISRSMLYLSAMVRVISSCHGANLEVSRTVDIIQDFLSGGTLDEDITEQLKSFHHQISSRDVSLSAGNFFKIDYILFGSMVISGLNYLIILFQMTFSKVNKKP
ncbi:uncharacterized protein LOC134533779 isoform X1 [Bacillus rossius redtenbacheri]|uniref:uncharacterized protein LOC134533779 isoform X1 n=1 Tax=Bacillus rossius redtenbacheri TaxID=93214 RepID=UPI002FDD13AC